MTKPDDSEKDCTTFDALFQPLKAFLTRHERDHPPHHREKLHFKEFVRRVQLWTRCHRLCGATAV